MFELVKSGGFMMWPIILCSIVAAGIIGERLWSLQKKYVAPPGLIDAIRGWLERQELDATRIAALRQSSPLGRILAAGLSNRTHDHEVIKEAIEDAGRHAAPELERYLNTLGTIAAITPFLGLMGTVIGMIQMFSGLGAGGMGDPSLIASGIAQALITTAAGLGVAIPAVIFFRYFRGRINELIVDMEQEAVRLVEILQGRRERME